MDIQLTLEQCGGLGALTPFPPATENMHITLQATLGMRGFTSSNYVVL